MFSLSLPAKRSKLNVSPTHRDSSVASLPQNDRGGGTEIAMSHYFNFLPHLLHNSAPLPRRLPHLGQKFI